MNRFSATVSAYFEASNAHNHESLTALFMPGAKVEDEGRTHHGLEEIRRWAENTQQEYGFTLEPLESEDQGGSTIVTCLVSGAFPGSPIQLHFVFTLEGDKIAALTIRDQ